MRAVVCRELSGPQSLNVEEVPDPKPGPGEVAIDVAAAGVNFADTLMVTGKYQEKPELPFTPGLELAGTVTALGAGVSGVAPGDRVIGLVDRGAFAEVALVRADEV
ncbi:MAG: alcohol dehydrogenase catalytic domain-containing protein, partial [Kiloniellales bacterium]|nr:alcohol dehydrogenase catalytic domain-containing protein [Kiloniellales bacterium]